MSRWYEINQPLARMQAQIESIDTKPTGPSRAVDLELLTPDHQRQALRDGHVYNGKVWS